MVKTIERLDELLSDDAVTSLLADGVEFSLRATNGSKAIQFHADDPGAEQALGWTGRAQDAGGRRTLAVTGAFDDIQLAQLALLAQLVPGADFERVPPQLPLADRLALRGVELVIEWAPFRLTSLVIRVASARPWTIVDGVFAVDDLEVAFVLSYPLERPAALSCRVDSVLKLGSAVSLDTHVDVPSLDVEIELADDQEVPLAPVLDRLFPGAGMPDLAFTYLHAEMSPRAQTYAFRGSLTGAWEVIPGAVALDALQLELSRAATSRSAACLPRSRRPARRVSRVARPAGSSPAARARTPACRSARSPQTSRAGSTSRSRDSSTAWSSAGPAPSSPAPPARSRSAATGRPTCRGSKAASRSTSTPRCPGSGASSWRATPTPTG